MGEIFANYFAQWNLTYLSVFLLVFLPALWQDIRSHEGHEITPDQRMKDAFKWTGIWVAISAAFGVFTWFMFGTEAAAAYAIGWTLEKTLALDNLFAFMAIFSSFSLMAPGNQSLQYRILHWGIIGAILFRTIFLGAGAFFVDLPTTNLFGLLPFEVNIVLLLFALIILYTVKEMWGEAFGDDDDEDEVDYTKHWSVKFTKKFFPVDPSIESGKFFVRKKRDERSSATVTWVTPLFLCLVCIEICDILFAFDSMPVIVAVVQDPNLMITSSLMACAGLRALYFALLAGKEMFCHLDKAVIGLLLFIVVKLTVASFGAHIPYAISLAVVALFISGGVVASLMYPEKKDEEDTTTT